VTRVAFVQTGGFAGLKLACDLDTATMPDKDAKALDAKVDAAMAERRKRSPRNPNLRDDQQYEVTVTRGNETTVLRGADPHLPTALSALVSYLQERAEPTR